MNPKQGQLHKIIVFREYILYMFFKIYFNIL